MPDALANLIFLVVLAAWIAGAITVWIRYRQAQRDYLSHFPPVNGYPLQESGL